MAVGLPLKTTYADGDVYSASDVNDTNGTINANVNPYSAGKNKIINGDFYVNQRNFSSTTTNATIGFDRWGYDVAGGTTTYSAQTFTPGAAPVAGYEGKSFARLASTGQSGVNDYVGLWQRIEDVRTLAGATATISFWAKASSGTPSVAVAAYQNFGGGGSATVASVFGKKAITTSWARYTITASVASITGKTIGTPGTDSNLALYLFTSAGSNVTDASGIGIQNATIDIWGVQLEQGSTATAFQTATGTIQGELAACQRYYWRVGGQGNYQRFGTAVINSSTLGYSLINNPVSMRVAPTVLEFSTLMLFDGVNIIAVTACTIDTSSSLTTALNANTAGSLTPGKPYQLAANNSSSAYIGLSAEL